MRRPDPQGVCKLGLGGKSTHFFPLATNLNLAFPLII